MEQREDSPRAPPARFYAITVTAGMEPKVAAVIVERVRALGLDVRSVLVPPNVKGYVILEAGDPGDVYEAVRGVRHVKKMKPVIMKLEEVMKLARPVMEVPKLEPGQVVEAVAGPFRGMRGKVVEISEQKGQVTIALLDSQFRATVTLALDEVRPLEEEQL